MSKKEQEQINALTLQNQQLKKELVDDRNKSNESFNHFQEINKGLRDREEMYLITLNAFSLKAMTEDRNENRFQLIIKEITEVGKQFRIYNNYIRKVEERLNGVENKLEKWLAKLEATLLLDEEVPVGKPPN